MTGGGAIRRCPFFLWRYYTLNAHQTGARCSAIKHRAFAHRWWMAGKVPWSFVMESAADITFPGGSKQRVTIAGNAVRNGTATSADVAVIDEWRAAHRHVLNTFQAILRTKTKGTDVIVAQRHKRKTTIFGKLRRFPSMQLARMDDVAGCRLIFPTIDELYEFRKKMHSARFQHVRKNDVDKYDYIKNPKNTGYRGVHDVYSYDVRSDHGKNYKGLLIEIQYRTIYQHAWATAVEVVGLITASQPKFQEGDKRYEEALSYASEIISRTNENMKSCHVNLSDGEVVKNFLDLDDQLSLMTTLRALNSIDNDVRAGRQNILLIVGGNENLEILTYRYATEALRDLFRLEGEDTQKDIVFVRGDSTGDVRSAFRNYFADATEFVSLIDEGCRNLARKI
jgi:ppGpp synthetase/RelA/SpoT-type nucleotidyltranferase